MTYKISDLHNDLPSILMKNEDYNIFIRNETNHTDIPRLNEGKIALQFFAACPCGENQISNPFESAVKMLTKMDAAITHSENLELVTAGSAVLPVVEKGKTAVGLTVEGGHALENNLDNLQHFYNLGVRCLTITWNNSHDWAVSAMDERASDSGLTEFGRSVVRKMNELKMIIDVSHAGEKTVSDVMNYSSGPVIASHSGVKKFNNHPRNLSDEQIKSIADSGGLIGVIFFPPFLHPRGSADLEEVINHIDYIASLVGVEFIAFGSDFDGIGTNTVRGLEDVSKFPFLVERMFKRGFTEDEIHKITFQNTLNLFTNICG